MNKTRIDWADYTWNPLTGCLHGCPYCYAREFATRFAGTKGFPNGFVPTWHRERLMQPMAIKKPGRVFAVSMGDPFGNWVESGWLDAMFAVMKCAPQHRFLLLTKRPQNIAQKLGPIEPIPHVWLGCTLTGAEGEQDPSPSMCELRDQGWHTFVSIEPLLGKVLPHEYLWAEWVILGALTPGKHEPDEEWVESVFIATCRTNTPLFVKENLVRYNVDYDCRCYPSGLRVHNYEL